MTWAGDGRATFEYGSPVVQGEPHIIWRRIGSHDILKRPYEGVERTAVGYRPCRSVLLDKGVAGLLEPTVVSVSFGPDGLRIQTKGRLAER